MKDDTAIRAARAEMENAKAQSERKFSAGQKIPRRYKLYDRIKDHVSLKSINAVIILTSVLIVVLLVVGIVTAGPRQ